jgi:hypothetical protein
LNAACLLSENARNTVIDLFRNTDDPTVEYQGQHCCAFGVAFLVDGLEEGKGVPLTHEINDILHTIAPQDHPLLAPNTTDTETLYTFDLLEADLNRFISEFSLYPEEIVAYFEHACDEHQE